MNYYIALKDKDGTDFKGQPWLIPLEEVKLDYVQKISNDLINRGYKDVTIFNTDNIPEEVEWEFVEENKIVE